MQLKTKTQEVLLDVQKSLLFLPMPFFVHTENGYSKLDFKRYLNNIQRSYFKRDINKYSLFLQNSFLLNSIFLLPFLISYIHFSSDRKGVEVFSKSWKWNKKVTFQLKEYSNTIYNFCTLTSPENSYSTVCFSWIVLFVSSFQERKGVCLFLNNKEPIYAIINFLTLVKSICCSVFLILEIFLEKMLTVTLWACHTLQARMTALGL